MRRAWSARSSMMTSAFAVRSAAAGIGVALCAMASVVVPGTAAAQGPDCPAAAVYPVLPGSTPLDSAENLGYDADGNLWVSRVFRNMVQRYDSAGRITAEVAVDAPGAVRAGPDGQLYVVYGDSAAGLLPGAHDSGVVRFDPRADHPVPQRFVSGLGMANGAAFDSAGNLQVADTARGVVRVRADGSIDADWSGHTALPGVNGIVVQGDSVYTTLFASATGRIVRIPIDAPSAQTTVAAVTLGSVGVTALPDDLAAGSDGMLYNATTTGKLVRVDPAGRAGLCTVADLGVPVTAVTAVPGDDRSLLVSSALGGVLRIVLAPR
ncbi:hypothetical protein AB0L57_26975 [Nocardia sp. NPDC052254]|uniref:SMP-30/gluconolactonase/LRE family protein n=1 Tax=Nocardia sp. NPDC052254 TaxID=3155681 RepID=UPI0034456678